MKKVGIIITYFKGKIFLNEAIKSINKQTYKNFQIYLFVDGGSDFDNKWNFINDDILVSISNCNLGQFSLINHFINEINEDYVFFLDNDDIWKSKHIEEHLKANSKFVTSRNHVLLPSGNYRKGGLRQDPSKSIKVNNYVGPLSQVSMDIFLLKSCLPLPNDLKSCRDWYLYIKILENLKIKPVVISSRTIIYRQHESAISSNKLKVIEGRKYFWKLINPSKNQLYDLQKEFMFFLASRNILCYSDFKKYYKIFYHPLDLLLLLVFMFYYKISINNVI